MADDLVTVTRTKSHIQLKKKNEGKGDSLNPVLTIKLQLIIYKLRKKYSVNMFDWYNNSMGFFISFYFGMCVFCVSCQN